jgi:hypothetical protein
MVLGDAWNHNRRISCIRGCTWKYYQAEFGPRVMRPPRTRTRMLGCPDADVRIEKAIVTPRRAFARIAATAAALTGRGQASASESPGGARRESKPYRPCAARQAHSGRMGLLPLRT